MSCQACHPKRSLQILNPQETIYYIFYSYSVIQCHSLSKNQHLNHAKNSWAWPAWLDMTGMTRTVYCFQSVLDSGEVSGFNVELAKAPLPRKKWEEPVRVLISTATICWTCKVRANKHCCNTVTCSGLSMLSSIFLTLPIQLSLEMRGLMLIL